MALAKASPRNQHVPDDRDQMGQSDFRPDRAKTSKLKLSTDFDENSEYSDLAEKIFENINASFERDVSIDEFDIVPVESKSNHSPVLHDATEHKLALESWCVPYLYTHSYKSFLAIMRKQKTSTSSSNYGNVKASSLSEADRISRGLLLSRMLTMLNPDLALAWNFRRDYVCIDSPQILECELRLVTLVATRKPKCPEGFSYRRWLVEKALDNDLLRMDTILQWVISETAAIEIPIVRYFSNYHAWNYRLWLIQKILQHEKVPHKQRILVLDTEVNYSNKWINTQVSDYCGHHYRQKLFQILLDNNINSNSGSESPESMLTKELEDNAKRIERYQGHETLWYHRRSVLEILVRLDFSGKSHNFSGKDLEEKERKFIQTVLDLSLGVSDECSQLNSKLCRKYELWLNRRFKSNIRV